MTDPQTNPSHRFITGAILFAVLIAVGIYGYVSRDGSSPGERDPAPEKTDRVSRYRNQLEKDPGNHAVRLKLGELLKPDEADQALLEFQKIPESADEYPEAVWHMAHIAIVKNDDQLGEKSLLTLNAIQPDNLGVVLSLAELYYRNERFSEAETWARQAVKFDPKRAESWLLLAEILDRLNRVAEMVQPLKEAKSLAPDLYAVRANLAYALHFAGQQENAEAEARWCLARKPEDIKVHLFLAQILRDQGRRQEALRQVEKALSLAPGDAELRLLKADLLLYDRKSKQAYETLKPLEKELEGRRDFLGRLARAAALSGRREEAQQIQERIMELIQKDTKLNPLSPAENAPQK